MLYNCKAKQQVCIYSSFPSSTCLPILTALAKRVSPNNMYTKCGWLLLGVRFLSCYKPPPTHSTCMSRCGLDESSGCCMEEPPVTSLPPPLSLPAQGLVKYRKINVAYKLFSSIHRAYCILCCPPSSLSTCHPLSPLPVLPGLAVTLIF